MSHQVIEVFIPLVSMVLAPPLELYVVELINLIVVSHEHVQQCSINDSTCVMQCTSIYQLSIYMYIHVYTSRMVQWSRNLLVQQPVALFSHTKY